MGEDPRLKLPEASFRKDQLTTEGEMPSVISGPNILLVIMFLEVCILDINWIDYPLFPNEELRLFIAECEEKEGK